MHFIGMLAYKMDMPVNYDPLLTVVSLAVAVVSAYGVLAIVSGPHLKIRQIVGGGILLGAGISTMHYIGVAAMNVPVHYRVNIFVLSIAIAITASSVALWTCFTLARYSSKQQKLLEICAAIILAAGICGMHYTGMAAVVFSLPMPMIDPVKGWGASGATIGIVIIGVILSVLLPLVVYQTIRDDQDEEGVASAFPAKGLSLTVLCAFAALIWLSCYSLYTKHMIKGSFAASDAVGSITSNLKWMSRVSIATAAILAVTGYFVLRSLRLWRQELRDNKTLMQTILDNMPLALFVKDVRQGYRYRFINRMAEEIFSMNNKVVVGHLDHDLFPKAEADFFRQTDELVMAGGKLIDIEAEPVTASKGTFTGHTIKIPIYDGEGKPQLLVGMIEDVTEKFKDKEELNQSRRRAEQADRTKSEFLANMSHELRTPLNSILGMTRLLQELGVTAEQRVLADTVFTSSTALLEIVNDILDLSKIESGAMLLEHIGFDLSYLQSNVIDRLHPLAREKGLVLKLEDSLPPVCRGRSGQVDARPIPISSAMPSNIPITAACG